MEHSRRKGLPDTASVLLPFNLGSDEIDPIRAFRPEEIVPSVQNFEKTLLVTRE